MNEKQTDNKAEPKRFKVKLAGKHEHGGKEYGKGDEITLREDQVKRLEERKLVDSKVPA